MTTKKQLSTNDIEDELRSSYPHGHPEFTRITLEELDLHSRKNKDYAGAGDPLGNFDRVSSILSLYPGFPVNRPVGVAIVYAMKQIDAIMWSLSSDNDLKVEGIQDKMKDVSVYFKLARIMASEEKIS